MDLHDDMVAMGQRALEASRELVRLGARKKNTILESMADALEDHRDAITAANALDMQDAAEAGLPEPIQSRLLLSEPRLDAIIKGIRVVAALNDPLGTTISRWIRPNGLEIVKQRVPIGVIGMVYESRPSVTANATALAIKTANAIILRGGKEALRTNGALVAALTKGGDAKGLPPHAIQFVETTDRAAVRELVQLQGMVDVAIIRGGDSLVSAVTEMARIPVIKHSKGLCHTYIDGSADLEMALNIAENAKCDSPGVCNAMETLLVHRDIADAFLPAFAARLQPHGVELRGDPQACRLVADMEKATAEDWSTEYLGPVLSVRIVDSVETAIGHINRFGSRHSEAIVASNEGAQKAFVQRVDAATVYINASTRFTDGAEFGMGTEVGVSTEKLHARGPIGLEELTTTRYVIQGKGQVRD